MKKLLGAEKRRLKAGRLGPDGPWAGRAGRLTGRDLNEFKFRGLGYL
jgi:hypothetical protein